MVGVKVVSAFYGFVQTVTSMFTDIQIADM